MTAQLRPVAVPAPPRHFLDLCDFDRATLRRILELAIAIKAGKFARQPLAGRTLALLFEKPSTRTRVSFEVAMRKLGGHVTVLTDRDMQLGRGETVADTARVLSRYVDAIMLRTDRVWKLAELAEHATVPVINGLTEASHPCQLMADIMTFEEHRGPIAGRTIAWLGARRRAGLGAGGRRQRNRHAGPGRSGARRRGRGDRLLRQHVGRSGPQQPCGAGAVSRDDGAHGAGGAGRAVHALPAGPSRRGGGKCRDRWTVVGGVR
jgi:hypothetical protein